MSKTKDQPQKNKERLLSVTAKDCEWDYVRGSGKGGQKRNKTSSAVRCRHLPSGSIGYSEDSRSQSENKRNAFRRMASTKEFQTWIKIEAARASGALAEAQRRIDRDLKDPCTTRVEGKNDKGQWTIIEKCEKGEG